MCLSAQPATKRGFSVFVADPCSLAVEQREARHMTVFFLLQSLVYTSLLG